MKVILPSTARDFKIGTDLMTQGLLYTHGIFDERRSFKSFGDARTCPIKPKIGNIQKIDDHIIIEIEEGI